MSRSLAGIESQYKLLDVQCQDLGTSYLPELLSKQFFLIEFLYKNMVLHHLQANRCTSTILVPEINSIRSLLLDLPQYLQEKLVYSEATKKIAADCEQFTRILSPSWRGVGIDYRTSLASVKDFKVYFGRNIAKCAQALGSMVVFSANLALDKNLIKNKILQHELLVKVIVWNQSLVAGLLHHFKFKRNQFRLKPRMV